MAVLEKRIRHGERVVAASGKAEGTPLAGVPLQVIRDEEFRFNSESGKEEAMVTARVIKGSDLGALIDMPKRRLVGHGSSRVGFTALYATMWDKIFGK